MAKNQKTLDAAAAKAKKQKIILVVMGVALLGLGVIQGPKLMKRSSPPAAAAPATSAATVPGATPAAQTGTAVVVRSTSGSGPKAVLAGVTIDGTVEQAPAADQLRSFSLFVVKDPFLPQVSEEEEAAAAASAAPPPPKPAPTPAPTSAEGGTSSGSSGSQPAGTPPPTDATITMNGQAYALTVKGQFPKAEPLFVLVSLKPKAARIGVAGGSFENGKTIALPMGKQITLVNDANGARYSLKLVYTGSGPETTESFTQAKK